MRTTLVIDDHLMRRIKALAAERRQTLSAVVEGLLRKGLEGSTAPSAGELPPLPSYRTGRMLVDVSDRDALFEAMEGDRRVRG